MKEVRVFENGGDDDGCVEVCFDCKKCKRISTRNITCMSEFVPASSSSKIQYSFTRVKLEFLGNLEYCKICENNQVQFQNLVRKKEK